MLNSRNHRICYFGTFEKFALFLKGDIEVCRTITFTGSLRALTRANNWFECFNSLFETVFNEILNLTIKETRIE